VDKILVGRLIVEKPLKMASFSHFAVFDDVAGMPPDAGKRRASHGPPTTAKPAAEKWSVDFIL